MNDLETLPPAPGQRPWNLLCVDDEPHVLSALHRLFRKKGGKAYRVLCANSGPEGLLLLEREPVDLVISDMRMPEMDGIHFLERVRARWPETVRILLTGHADINSTIDAINRGEIYRYIAKPWDNDAMQAVVRQALERKALEAEKARCDALTRREIEALKKSNVQLKAQVQANTAALQVAHGDIASVKEAQERADYLAHHDLLTGLPNRLLFNARIQHAIEQAERRQGIFSVVFIDLDRFKEVNDRLGHAMGDDLLRDVARAMQETLREEDTLARFGGDEFVLLIEGLESEAAALGVIDKLLALFPRRVGGDGGDIAVGASIGMSFYPRDGETASRLIGCADGAMYQAKAGGRELMPLRDGAEPKRLNRSDNASGASLASSDGGA